MTVRPTDTFAQRIAIGEPHELAVCDALWLRGWLTQRIGQGQLNAVVRGLLRDYRSPNGAETLLRWDGDILTVKRFPDRVRAWVIDAKCGDKHMETGNHDAEIKAVDGLEAAATLYGIPGVFVFGDYSTATPNVIRQHGHEGPRPDPKRTRFLIFPKTVCTPFDAVFGRLESPHEMDESGAA